ncbi:LysR family transcriptional regulator [Pseudostreptobacillus hongkongensis]|uniref:LysR family transcriptional regulator n=1 Tax=Pseudostreptobacillus hongkongensis TaxID=1162717 RepID=UPI0028D652AB|nr:LysR family transcriptional regulator [Pseudostreptobacillus hongkongensis]
MDIHHLRIFYEVCKNQSFTRTAEKLYISQSAVSIQIKKLEASLQTQLIERSSKNFKLTYIGQELFKLTEEIFDKFLRVENEMNKLINSKKSKIIIGATHNIGEPVLPKIITEYVKQYPNIEFDIYIKNSSSLIKYLKEGNIDVALMEDDFFEDRTLKFIQSEEYPFVVIAPPDIKDIEDIKKLNVLKKDTPNAIKYLDKFEDIIGHYFENKTIVNGSNETIKNLVMNNMGLSVLPYYCVYEEIKAGKMNLVHTFETNEDKFYIAFLKENEKKEWISNFLKFMREYNINYEFESLINKNK